MKKIIKVLGVLSNYVEDFFILIGLSLIVMATFKLNYIAGIYVLGFILLVLGGILARKPHERR